jgi:plasmid stability protein
MTLEIELPDDCVMALKAKALEHGVSAEQYARQVLEQDLAVDSTEARRPISDDIQEIWADMPEAVRDKLPADGASQVDHYVYGLPKRDV